MSRFTSKTSRLNWPTDLDGEQRLISLDLWMRTPYLEMKPYSGQLRRALCHLTFAEPGAKDMPEPAEEVDSANRSFCGLLLSSAARSKYQAMA